MQYSDVSKQRTRHGSGTKSYLMHRLFRPERLQALQLAEFARASYDGRPSLEHPLGPAPPARPVGAPTDEDLDDELYLAAALAPWSEHELLGLVVALGDGDEHTPELLGRGERGRGREVGGCDVREERGGVGGEVRQGAGEAGLGEDGQERVWSEGVDDEARGSCARGQTDG